MNQIWRLGLKTLQDEETAALLFRNASILEVTLIRSINSFGDVFGNSMYFRPF